MKRKREKEKEDKRKAGVDVGGREQEKGDK